MEKDENKVEGQQQSQSSGDKQTTSDSSEAAKTPEDQRTVPYDRFKDVIDERNALRESGIQDLKKEIESLKQQKEPLEEPLDWKEAQERAVDKALTAFERKAKEKEAKKKAKEERIERSFEQLKGIGQEITPEIKKTVLRRMIRTGSSSVLDTYREVREENIKSNKAKERKEKGNIPSSQKGSGAGKGGLSYKQLRSKSLDQIVEESTKKAK